MPAVSPELLAAAEGLAARPGGTGTLGAAWPLQGRVHLVHVQRPQLAGPRLELLTQPQTVFGSLTQ